VRTYSVLNGLEQVPELAAQHKLNTTIGAWISSDLPGTDILKGDGVQYMITTHLPGTDIL
jgi:exo-beta-1,3-glucanase (GH17 family)